MQVGHLVLCICNGRYSNMATKKSDLYVITKVKEFTKYVITVTEKSPKKIRFTLVARLQNYCLDSLEQIVMANLLPVSDPRRLEYQKEAGRGLETLGYFAMLCMECECILPKQYEFISKLQAESLMFLGKWISSDKKRNRASSGDMPQKDALVGSPLPKIREAVENL